MTLNKFLKTSYISSIQQNLDFVHVCGEGACPPLYPLWAIVQKSKVILYYILYLSSYCYWQFLISKNFLLFLKFLTWFPCNTISSHWIGSEMYPAMLPLDVSYNAMLTYDVYLVTDLDVQFPNSDYLSLTFIIFLLLYYLNVCYTNCPFFFKNCTFLIFNSIILTLLLSYLYFSSNSLPFEFYSLSCCYQLHLLGLA